MAVVFSATLVVLACGSSDPGPSTIEEGSWRLTSGVDMVPGRPLTVTFGARTGTNSGFADNGVTGLAACNRYYGTYEVDDSSLTAGPFGSDLIGCSPAVIESMDTFLEALEAVDKFALSGRELLLTGPEIELRFEWLPPVPTAEFIDIPWTLEAIIDEDGSRTEPTGEPATLLLRSDGTFEGFSGCRTYTGEWSTEGAFMRQNLAHRPTGECPPELSAQDRRFPGMSRSSAHVDGDRLTFTTLHGLGVVYRAQDR